MVRAAKKGDADAVKRSLSRKRANATHTDVDGFVQPVINIAAQVRFKLRKRKAARARVVADLNLTCALKLKLKPAWAQRCGLSIGEARC